MYISILFINKGKGKGRAIKLELIQNLELDTKQMKGVIGLRPFL